MTLYVLQTVMGAALASVLPSSSLFRVLDALPAFAGSSWRRLQIRLLQICFPCIFEASGEASWAGTTASFGHVVSELAILQPLTAPLSPQRPCRGAASGVLPPGAQHIQTFGPVPRGRPGGSVDEGRWGTASSPGAGRQGGGCTCPSGSWSWAPGEMAPESKSALPLNRICGQKSL